MDSVLIKFETKQQANLLAICCDDGSLGEFLNDKAAKLNIEMCEEYASVYFDEKEIGFVHHEAEFTNQ